MSHLLKRFLLGCCQRDGFTLETVTRKASMLLSPKRERVSGRGEEEGLFVEKTLIFKRGKQFDVFVVDGRAEIWIETASGICFSAVSQKYFFISLHYNAHIKCFFLLNQILYFDSMCVYEGRYIKIQGFEKNPFLYMLLMTAHIDLELFCKDVFCSDQNIFLFKANDW